MWIFFPFVRSYVNLKMLYKLIPLDFGDIPIPKQDHQNNKKYYIIKNPYHMPNYIAQILLNDRKLFTT